MPESKHAANDAPTTTTLPNQFPFSAVVTVGIDSGKFSYRRLVDDAVNGLLADSPSAVATTWSEMVIYLRRAAQLCKPETMHLHDAAMHLIHETLSGQHRASQCAETLVSNSISQLGLSGWFHGQSENLKSDSLSWRSPWIWRSV